MVARFPYTAGRRPSTQKAQAMSATLAVPATLAKCVREGLHIEIGNASEQVTDWTQFPRELHVEIYREPLRIQCEALAVLEEVGGVTPVPPAPFEVNLDKHHSMMLRVIHEQRESYIDRKDEVEGSQQRKMSDLIREFDSLVAEVQAHGKEAD
jgi:hypothetical protein